MYLWTVLFQTIRFSISSQFSSIWPIRPYQVLSLRSRVDLGAMAMKGYSVFPKPPVLLKPHHQIVWCRWGSLTVCKEAVGVFYSPSRLGNLNNCWYAIKQLNQTKSNLSLPLSHTHTHTHTNTHTLSLSLSLSLSRVSYYLAYKFFSAE